MRFLSRTTVVAAIMIAAFPAPARAAAPVVDVFCESLGRYRVLCERTIVGGTAPFNTKWYYNGIYIAAHENKAFAGFSCSISGPNSYHAVVTDATGASGSDTSGVGCRSGNP